MEDRTTPTLLPDSFVVVGADAGSPPEVRLLDATSGTTITQFLAFDPAFYGGVRVATGDLNGDNVTDLVVAAGPGGGPIVRAFSGVDGGELGSFFAYAETFSGGIHIAVGDINNDGFDDIITGAGAGGGAQISAFSGQDFSQVANFFAYDPEFTGGVRVATADIDGNGFAEIVTGAGASGGPHVQVFDLNGQSVGSFFAYDPSFQFGVFVAGGDVNGDGRDDIITGTSFGGGAHVRTFVNARGQQLAGELGSFFAYESTFTGGVRVAAQDMDGDGLDDIITAPGPTGASAVKVFSQTSTEAESSFFAFPSTYLGGTFIAAGVGQVTYPLTPNDEIQNAYEELYYQRAQERLKPPPVTTIVLVPYFIPVNNAIIPFWGWGGAGFWPFFYDAPGLYLNSGFFYEPAFFTGFGVDVYDPGFYADPLYYPELGYYDPGVYDPGIVDPLYVDPFYSAPLEVVDPYMLDSSGFYDPGFVDPGFVDPGFVDPGYSDGGFYDAGFYDPGYTDPGFYDAGFYDTGFYDAGFYGGGFSDFGGYGFY